MSVLLIAELNKDVLSLDTTAKALAAVQSLGPVTILVAGKDCTAAADSVARLAGVSQVLLADHAAFEHGLAETFADLVVSLSGEYSHIVAAATANAKNVLPRVAALLDVMIVPDVTAIIDAETFERPIYAGNAVQRLRSSDGIKVISIRTAGFTAAEQSQEGAQVSRLEQTALETSSCWVEDKVEQSERLELTSADIVVSGGRGMGSRDGFHLIETLADKLGAAVGASRAAVDAGYAPNDSQVGQTGKIVSPSLYIAVGISGAIQHLAGMKDSKIIVAINKDEDAPIFRVADFGLKADLFTAVPELISKL